MRSLKNIFRTEVDTSIEINNRKHTDKFILMGSCFSDEMFKYFSKFCFDILKPYGTIFNPITLSKNLEKAILNIKFQEKDLLKTDDFYLSWNHSGKYYNRYEKLLLKIINEEQQKINKLIEENNIVVDKETLKKEIEDKSKSFKDPEQYVNWIYGNEEQLKNIESLVLEDKVAEYLENKSKVEEELLSFEEIVSMG